MWRRLAGTHADPGVILGWRTHRYSICEIWWFPTTRLAPGDSSKSDTTISEDYSQLGILRDAVTELAQPARVAVLRRRSAWVSASICWASSAKRGNAVAADGGALALFYLAKTEFQLGDTTRRSPVSRRQGGRVRRRPVPDLRRRSAALPWAMLQEAMDILDNIFGASRANGRVHLPARCHGGGARWQSEEVIALYNRALRYDDRASRVRCLVWRWRAIAAATTNAHLQTVRTSRRLLPDPRRDADQSGNGLRRPQCITTTAQACYKRILDVFPDHPRARSVHERCLGVGRHVFYDEESARQQRTSESGAEHFGHRFRTVGPQPQLPAEDGHRHAGRSGAHHRERSCCRARISAKRRLHRNPRDAAFQGLGAGQVRPISSANRIRRWTCRICRPTSRRCSIDRSPT